MTILPGFGVVPEGATAEEKIKALELNRLALLTARVNAGKSLKAGERAEYVTLLEKYEGAKKLYAKDKKELAGYLGVSRETVSAWSNKNESFPKPDERGFFDVEACRVWQTANSPRSTPKEHKRAAKVAEPLEIAPLSLDDEIKRETLISKRMENAQKRKLYLPRSEIEVLLCERLEALREGLEYLKDDLAQKVVPSDCREAFFAAWDESLERIFEAYCDKLPASMDVVEIEDGE